MDFLSLDPLLRQALQEDLGRGDITTEAILQSNPHADGVRTAQVLARQRMVLAGWPVFIRVFQLLGPVTGRIRYGEGDWVETGCMGTLEGSVSILLKAERVALNFLQRLCGIATRTRGCVDRVGSSRVRVLDTRKTTPLWRSLEKYAVRMGGGQNHRMGLDDGVLIKENHIAAAGGVAAAVRACRERCGHLQRIQVEVTHQGELADALDAGADAVLLDNMPAEEVRRSVAACAGRCLVEVSGGITGQNLQAYAETGVDFISMGSLTHSVASSDISLILDRD
jgi:nicotinate-nucleotide pyrophosphorylase (carboxylating)